MRKYVALDHTPQDINSFTSDIAQNLRRTVLAPSFYRPRIQEALRRDNFTYHRTCSFSNLLRECSAGEGETFLMYWACARYESKATMSLSVSSSSSLQSATRRNQQSHRSVAQQTEITCRYPSGVPSPVNIVDRKEQRAACARLAGSVTPSSPNSPLLPSHARSVSILGSVCALLLSKQGSAVAKEAPSFTGSRQSENICRICFGGGSAERLVQPCSCRGTIAAVHRTCLERWLLQAATSYCELCRHHYIVTRSHKWSWWRSLWEWGVSGRGRALAGDVWRGAALGALSVLGTARALHACDRVLQAGARRGGSSALAANLFSSLLIGVIGALNGLLTTWILLKIQEHQLSWQAWRDSTLHVHITLEEEPISIGISDVTVVADQSQRATVDRSTNIADPFMVTRPYVFPDP